MNKNNILIIYHHKTGCVLSKKLINFYDKILNKKISTIVNYLQDGYKNIDNKRIIKNFETKYILNSKYNIYFQASPFYAYNIFNNLNKIDKVVHFIRNPYEQAISNFNYHLQTPTPEKWFLNISNNYENWFSNIKMIKLLFHILDINIGLIEKAKIYLKENFTPNKNLSYYENIKVLRLTDESKALKIETLRFIFCTKHVLKMASIIINNKKNNNLLYVNMNDFKKDKINHTITQLSSFLFRDELIDNKRIINFYNKEQENKNSEHISNKTQQEKDNLKNSLFQNKVIKRIFNKISRIIQNNK